jgi:hypothetical protein
VLWLEQEGGVMQKHGKTGRLQSKVILNIDI